MLLRLLRIVDLAPLVIAVLVFPNQTIDNVLYFVWEAVHDNINGYLSGLR